MDTFHISREEAAKDFDGLIDRVRNGGEVLIEEEFHPVVVLRATAGDRPILLSEALRRARERGSTVTLDGEFEKDLNDVINSHLEPMFGPDYDPWA